MSTGKYLEIKTSGKQSKIYLNALDDVIRKVFHTQPDKNVQEQWEFLQDNKASGVVPWPLAKYPKEGIIWMGYLRGYVELKELLKKIKAKTNENEKSREIDRLLRALALARRRLRLDKWYRDLINEHNILVKQDPSQPYGFDVKFVEGGVVEPTDSDDAESNVARWLQALIIRMKIGNVPLAREIARDRPWPKTPQ